MISRHDDENGRDFLGREEESVDKAVLLPAVQGKRVLITGAGGFIGSALARALAEFPVEHLSLLDMAEAGLQELGSRLHNGPAAPHDLVVGDVCDPELISHLFQRYRPQIVLHAAACKHVALMEQNPFAAARTNVLGSQKIAHAACAFGVEQLVVISTDKAVDPAGMMGVTKRIAELIVLANRSATRMKAVRFGNVFGSTGSIVPILRCQIARGGPITITDASCARYFTSIHDVVGQLLLSLLIDSSAAVIVPRPGSPYRILDLAHFLVASAGLDKNDIEHRFTGLRPGEKLEEQMTSDEEVLVDSPVPGLQKIVKGDSPSREILDAAIEEIRASIHEWDLPRLLRAISCVVPSYRPSAYLQQRAEEQVLRSATA